MEQLSHVFPAVSCLGLQFVPDDEDWAWEAFFQDDPTRDNAGGTDTRPTAAKGRRGGWRRDFKRNPAAVLKYEQNRYDYTKSPWWEAFVVKAADARVPGSRESVEFHHIFNVPFPVYDELLRLTQESDSPFKDKYAPGEHKGAPRTPVALKILVVLFCLKENVSFVGAIQAGQIGASTARSFFHKWIAWIVDKVYEKYVHPPHTAHEISSTMPKFERLGLPGCITLFDAVHVLGAEQKSTSDLEGFLPSPE